MTDTELKKQFDYLGNANLCYTKCYLDSLSTEDCLQLLNYVSNCGYSSLHKLYFRPKFLQLLIKYGANINAVDTHNGWTPLHWCCFMGSFKSCIILVENGCNLSLKDNKQQTPLIVTSESLKRSYCSKSLSMLLFLLKNGANPSKEANNNINFVDIIKEKSTHIENHSRTDTKKYLEILSYERI